MTEQTSIEMPKYRSHKTVHALKIGGIKRNKNGTSVISFEDDRFESQCMPRQWTLKCDATDQDLGYLVAYSDGYRSWSPSEAFESGYSRI